jgi:hypothetical protein
VTGKGYQEHLAELLEVHEGMNALGHVRGNHRPFEGDVSSTLPAYLSAHPETLIALAYFDLALYVPTRDALEAIKPHLMPGSLLILDEIIWPSAPGEALAFKEVFADVDWTIEKARHHPAKGIVTVH